MFFYVSKVRCSSLLIGLAFGAVNLLSSLSIRAEVVSQSQWAEKKFVADEYLIKVRNPAAAITFAEDFGLEVQHKPLLKTRDGQWFKVKDAQGLSNLQELQAHVYSDGFLQENVLHIEKNLRWHALSYAGDPRPGRIPQLPKKPRKDPLLNRVFGLTKVKAYQAWSKSIGSSSVVVADIDTGIDYNHQDLINNLWRNTREIPGDKIDNDGNGYVDDVMGWDFINKDPLPWDDNGHGTHTSGSIAATGGNGVGISGVAQRASLMGLKFLGDDGSGTTDDAILAINYAVANGASILSNSWGGDEYSKALEDAISEAAARNVLFVAAAGNDGTNNDTLPLYPAAYNLPNVIAVAASDVDDALVDYSNYGVNSVHIVAPGDRVYSTLPGDNYGLNSGTSMACPHVAGAAVLLKSFKPELTAVQIKKILLESVDKFPEYADKIVSGGRLNVERALSFAAGEPQ